LSPETTVIEIGGYLETKIAAFKAHGSQAPLWPRVEESIRLRGRREMFHLSASMSAAPVGQETDLFAGVSEEG
jgi:LmbE family N-acetylglucosaminyl deacetylase